MKQGSIRKIIVKKLQGTKLKLILNPHLLTDEMKKERYDWCWRMLLKIAVDPGILDQIVKGDETYLFFEQVRNPKQWTFPDGDTPRGVKQTRFMYKNN